jgi:hypothetical protein
MKNKSATAVFAFVVIASVVQTFAAGDGAMVIFSNPTNSTPRIVSMWGGGASLQIVMKSDGTVWD